MGALGAHPSRLNTAVSSLRALRRVAPALRHPQAPQPASECARLQRELQDTIHKQLWEGLDPTGAASPRTLQWSRSGPSVTTVAPMLHRV